MHISDFDYELPEELIAQQPLGERDASRMLLVDRAARSWQDSQFKTISDQLNAGDVLVINNTRVFPARLRGARFPSGGQVEVLLLRETEPNLWTALTRPARRLRVGDEVRFGADLRGHITDSLPDGVRVIRFNSESEINALIDRS